MNTGVLSLEMTSAGSFKLFESGSRFFAGMGNDVNKFSCASKVLCELLQIQGGVESIKESLKSLKATEDIIRNSIRFEELIAIAGQALSTEIAVRLSELHSQPYDPEEEEEPLNRESIRYFLLYCLKRGIEGRPILSATPSGLIQADWRPDKVNRFSIRFFPDGKAWVAVRTPSVRKSQEVLVRDLLSEHSPFQIPEWV